MAARFLRHLSGTANAPRHRIVVATATTADGVTAHLQASYLLTVADAAAAGRDVDEVVEARLESGLRHLIATHPVSELPISGEAVDVVAEAIVGVRIEHLTVESADVVVSPALRRLVVRGP